MLRAGYPPARPYIAWVNESAAMTSTSERTLVEKLPATSPDSTRAVGMARHYLHYSSSTVLMMAAGLISFPVLTRLLDNTEYGILGYYETWLMIAVALIKLGGQHSILRLYPFGGDQARLTHFATNLVLLPMIASIGIWSLGVVVLACISRWGGVVVPPMLWCALFLLPLLVFISQVEMTLRASERSLLLAVTRVSSRWLELVLILAAVLAIQSSALAVYGGKIAAAAIMVAFYVRWVRRHLAFSREALDLRAFSDSLRYSLPLVANELAGAVLVSIDRVMLKGMLGDYAAVGIYTIGCALAMQVAVIMQGALWGAFNPVVNRVHDTEGPAQVRVLKSRMLVPVTYASAGIGVAIWVAGADLLETLTGPSKVASGPVFVWLGTLFALLPVLGISSYGLLLQKRTTMVLMLTIGAALLNIALNLLWIPVYGVMGSVYATVVSYVLHSIGHCVLCPRVLLQFPDAKVVLVAGAAVILFIAAQESTQLSGLSAPWARLLAAGALWLACYVLPVLLLDRRLRRLVWNWRTATAA